MNHKENRLLKRRFLTYFKHYFKIFVQVYPAGRCNVSCGSFPLLLFVQQYTWDYLFEKSIIHKDLVNLVPSASFQLWGRGGDLVLLFVWNLHFSLGFSVWFRPNLEGNPKPLLTSCVLRDTIFEILTNFMFSKKNHVFLSQIRNFPTQAFEKLFV